MIAKRQLAPAAMIEKSGLWALEGWLWARFTRSPKVRSAVLGRLSQNGNGVPAAGVQAGGREAVAGHASGLLLLNRLQDKFAGGNGGWF